MNTPLLSKFKYGIPQTIGIHPLQRIAIAAKQRDCLPREICPSFFCRSVRPFRAFAVLSAVSCRLRLSVASSVLPVRFAAYTSVVSRPPVPCAARDFLVRNTLDAMPLWPNNIFFSLFKLSDG